MARGEHGRVLELLGRRMVGGDLGPGTVLPREAELAEDLGISRSVVREAMRVLAAKGLIETRQKLGTRVRPHAAWNLLDPDVLAWHVAAGPDPVLARQLVELRRMIEPPAARLAAVRRTDKQLAGITEALLGMRNATGAAAYYRADLAFHRAVFAACGNPLVDRLGDIVAAVLEVSFGLQQRSLLTVESGLPLHAAVHERIESADPDGAEAGMLAIIDAAEIELDRALTTEPAR